MRTKQYKHSFFVKAGRSWWEGLSEEEKQKKRELNKRVSVKYWKKHKGKKRIKKPKYGIS